MMTFCKSEVIPWFLQQGYRSGNYILDVSVTMSTSVVDAERQGMTPRGETGSPIVGIDDHGLLNHYHGLKGSVKPSRGAPYGLYEFDPHARTWKNANKNADR